MKHHTSLSPSTFKRMIVAAIALLALTNLLTSLASAASDEIPAKGALDGVRHRILVSTDIGGTDPDDFQSMCHILLYADILDIEGLVSSAFGEGRAKDILEVIDAYEKDFHNIKTYSENYPTPDELRAITKQGEKLRAPFSGVRGSTEGSDWIIQCARRDDPRPLYVLVWGGIEDLAQALHDAPDIKSKIRVYWIGGPNKKWSADAYQYIADNHKDLWIIESNAAYRGWFVGGEQSGEWGNVGFVDTHLRGKGALGDLFAEKMGHVKMGDTPSVGWVLKGDPSDPSKPGWGGRYTRAWDRPFYRHSRMTTHQDEMEVFGVLELAIPMGDKVPADPKAILAVDNQRLEGHAPGDGTMRWRFCPKGVKKFDFRLESNVPALDGVKGGVNAVPPAEGIANHPSSDYPNWWVDIPGPELADDGHDGSKTVSRWRLDFLKDYAKRQLRTVKPASH